MKHRSYWLDTVPAAPTPESHIPNHVDVAIVGGGYTGLAAARRLAMSGASVAVLERDAIGSGASSRNGGQVLAGLKLDATTLVAKYGERKARELFDVSRDAIAALEALIAEESMACEYERCGHVHAAWKPSHFSAFRDEQALLARVFAHRVELVPASEQRSELGSDVYHGLLIDEASGAINPAQYVAGLAAAARRRRACLCPAVAVHAIRRNGQRWRVSTSAGELDAADVLVATNGYTGSASPSVQRRFVPVGSYIVATEPLSDDEAAAVLPKRRVAFDSKHFLFYFRVTRDRRLLFGGRAQFSAPTSGSTDRAAAILRRGLARVFPGLASKRIDYVWSGNVAFTRDQMPHAGKLDGMYFAGGYCGHGIAMATHLGDVIARRIAGEPLVHPMIDDRTPAIPLYSGRPWFLPLVGAYYKVMDWLQ